MPSKNREDSVPEEQRYTTQCCCPTPQDDPLDLLLRIDISINTDVLGRLGEEGQEAALASLLDRLGSVASV